MRTLLLVCVTQISVALLYSQRLEWPSWMLLLSPCLLSMPVETRRKPLEDPSAIAQPGLPTFTPQLSLPRHMAGASCPEWQPTRLGKVPGGVKSMRAIHHTQSAAC